MTDLGLDHLVSGPYRSTVPSTFSAYTTLFRSGLAERPGEALQVRMDRVLDDVGPDLLELGLQRRPDVGMVLEPVEEVEPGPVPGAQDRKSTRLNSSHVAISYAVFCLKKKKQKNK